MRNKYRNIKTTLGNLTFDSIKESQRYAELLLLQKAGEIKDLELQPEFVLQIGFTDAMGVKHRPIVYIADFRYWDNKRKKDVVEDVKGFRTEVYKLKQKLLLYAYQDFEFNEL